MLRNEIQSAILDYLDELVGTYFAQWALLGSLVTLMNVTTYGTTEFLCHNLNVLKLLLCVSVSDSKDKMFRLNYNKKCDYLFLWDYQPNL